MIVISTGLNVIETSLRTVDRVANIVDIMTETAEIYANEVVLDAECTAACAKLDREYKNKVAEMADIQRYKELEELGVVLPVEAADEDLDIVNFQ